MKNKEFVNEEKLDKTVGGDSGSIVSFREDKVIMPNIIGMNLFDAKEKLLALKLKVDSKYEKDFTKPRDTVLLTEPLAGCEIDVDDKVLLVLSLGKLD